MILDEMTYREIYNDLNRYEDVDRLYKRYSRSKKFSWEFFLVVYTQRTIRDVTAKFQKIKSKAPSLYRRWKKGTSLIDLSDELNFSPVMTAFIILTSQDYGRNGFRKMINDPESVENKRLSRELRVVRDRDPVYSPEGNEVQRKRGVKGEATMKTWLDRMKVGYQREEDLRERGGKTPDFLLDRTIYFRGEEVNWIESKGSFGDMREIKKNLKKQLRSYKELFGPGMVIYWFGVVDDAPVEEGIIIETREVLEDHWDLD
jgi:hypothetical protein